MSPHDPAKPRSEPPPGGTLIRPDSLPGDGDRPFLLVPDAGARAALASELGISAIRKLRFEGRLIPAGRRDWRLEAALGATVVQPCVVTLAPVTTRIDEPVERVYVAGMELPTEPGEVEMPEDDRIEPLPEVLDLAAVMAEALALALPAFPRAAGVEPGDASFAAPGAEPLADADMKPFSGLSSLRDKLRRPQ